MLRCLAAERGGVRNRARRAVVLFAAASLIAGCAKGNAPGNWPTVNRSAPVYMRQPSAAPQPAVNRSAPFASFNVPNLHYVEDDWRFTSMLRYRLPNEFEIHDALQSVALLGGSVVRIYTLSVRKPTDTSEVVRHVLGPGQFNEEAFKALDRVLATASALGIRIIIPFVDNWSYWGGVTEYAAFRGKAGQAFFTDEQLISDFERTLEHVLLRTNTINGRSYRADPTIYAWEIGNELGGPDGWVSRIARYIKRLDPDHPLIDGSYGPLVREHSLGDSNIDIVSTHHYGPVSRSLAAIDSNVRVIAQRKRYLIGEFGMLSAADTERVLRHALAQPLEGLLIWSLRSHNRDGGYYHHMEKPPFQAYHFPGSILGHDYEEQTIMRLMRHYAFSARHQETPALPQPAAPSMLPVSSLAEVRWRGSLGARYYVVERQIGFGIWEIVADRVDEAQTPYRPGFVDDTVPIGATARYRVIAANETGLSEPSLPSEEVHITGRLTVDEMSNPRLIKKLTGPLEFTTEHAELCKMDRDRLRGTAGAEVRYAFKGRATAVRVFAFVQDAGKAFELAWSSNGHDFKQVVSDEQSLVGAVDQPVAFSPVLTSCSSIPPIANELSIRWLRPAEIGRLELQML